MKKMFLLALSFCFLSTTSAVFAEDAPQASAPTVIAPAQPPAAQTVVSGDPAASAQSPASAGQAQPPSLMGMAMPFLIMLGIMYFLMIRPQQKRMKEHQSLLSGLKTGDEVITSAGILGTISGMSEKVVTLEVSKNVQLKILKSQVNQVVKGPIKDIQPNA